jgi:hypothetical protein
VLLVFLDFWYFLWLENIEIFSFHPPWLFFTPSGFPFLPLILKFGTRFPKFFLPWIWTSECIFRSFRRIWTRKTSENTFRSFWTGVKSEYWGVKKSHGGWEENLSFDEGLLENRPGNGLLNFVVDFYFSHPINYSRILRIFHFTLLLLKLRSA